MKIYLIFAIGFIITIIAVFIYGTKEPEVIVENTPVEITLMQEDLYTNYPALSSDIKHQIMDSILEESQKYNINPIILYAILHTESSFLYWKEHKPINIWKDGKKQQIKAVGLGGIVWEWWGDALRAKNICETRADLFIPEKNIAATAYIYNTLLTMPLHKKAKNINESAMLRYFGGYYPEYPLKIVEKIEKVLKNN